MCFYASQCSYISEIQKVYLVSCTERCRVKYLESILYVDTFTLLYACLDTFREEYFENCILCQYLRYNKCVIVFFL